MDFFYPHSLEDTLVFNRWTMGKKTVELIWRNGMLNIGGILNKIIPLFAISEGFNKSKSKDWITAHNVVLICYLFGD